MQHLLEKIDGWVQSGPQGNDKQWIWAAIGIATAASNAYSAHQNREAAREVEEEQRRIAQKNYQTQTKMLAKVQREGTRLGPHEAQALQRLEKGAREGTMDVEGLTQQTTAPVYQAGAESKQQAQGQVITQGLEGSIVAQEIARKIDTGTMQTIATQARQIALANEATKAQVSQALTTAQLSRAERLKQIAMNYETGMAQAKMARDARTSQANITGIQADASYGAAMAQVAGNLVTAGAEGIQQEMTSQQLEELGLIVMPDGSYYDPNQSYYDPND